MSCFGVPRDQAAPDVTDVQDSGCSRGSDWSWYTDAKRSVVKLHIMYPKTEKIEDKRPLVRNTGFFITGDRHILTCGKDVIGASVIGVRQGGMKNEVIFPLEGVDEEAFDDKMLGRADIVFVSEKANLAILQLRQSIMFSTPTPFLNWCFDPLYETQQLHSFGYPGNEKTVMSSIGYVGIVGNSEKQPRASIPVNLGAFGSLVVNDFGEAVAMLQSTSMQIAPVEVEVEPLDPTKEHAPLDPTKMKLSFSVAIPEQSSALLVGMNKIAASLGPYGCEAIAMMTLTEEQAQLRDLVLSEADSTEILEKERRGA